MAATNTASIRLEVGKKYKTRDGRVAEITREDHTFDEDSTSRWDGLVEGEVHCWRYDGRYLQSGEMLIDLVEEVVEEVVEAPAYRYFVRRAGRELGTRIIWRLDPRGGQVHCRDLEDPCSAWTVSSHSPRTLLEDDKLVESCEDGVALVAYHDAAPEPIQLKTTPDLTDAQRTRVAKLAARITLADGPVLSIDELAGMTVGELVTNLDETRNYCI